MEKRKSDEGNTQISNLIAENSNKSLEKVEL
jgi:hypothetical protein